jgi:hypothetical protein
LLLELHREKAVEASEDRGGDKIIAESPVTLGASAGNCSRCANGEGISVITGLTAEAVAVVVASSEAQDLNSLDSDDANREV